MRRGGGSCLISAEMPTNFVQLRRSVLATFREDFCSLSLRVCGGVSLSLSLSLSLSKPRRGLGIAAVGVACRLTPPKWLNQKK